MRLKNLFLILMLAVVINGCKQPQQQQDTTVDEPVEDSKRPNILFAIADDMSWTHFGLVGCKAVQTPSIDYLAQNGVIFRNAYCSAPSCTASRGAILTGRNGWELEEGACLWSLLPAKFKTYTEYLEEAGYFVGFTGKGWGPGDWKDSGRSRNPAGKSYNEIKTEPYPELGGDIPISQTDYSANFERFMENRPADQPFCFWYGAFEPHRNYLKGIGSGLGKRTEDIRVPGFLPDVPEVRSDILDYLVEVEWFDLHLGKMIDLLKKSGELHNTLVVVTSDNGMPFPRAKSNLYEYGTHMPLVIYWPQLVPGGRILDDLVSFIDLAPTFLDAAGLEVPDEITGNSLLDILNSNVSGLADPKRIRVFTYRERHAWCQPEGKIYPMRAIRKEDYLFIWNLKPDMYPAGHPKLAYNFNYYPYGDVDNSPSKDFLLTLKDNANMKWYYNLAFGKRSEFELYHITEDPYQLKNLINSPEYRGIAEELKKELKEYLEQTGDLRMQDRQEVYYQAPYYAMKGLKSGGMLLKQWDQLNEEEKQLAVEREKRILEENRKKLTDMGWMR